MDMDSAEYIKAFDPRLRPYLQCLISKQSLFGLQGPIQILHAASGCGYAKENFDRCQILIPYAMQNLTWEIIFDLSNVKEPPDMIFDPEDDDFHPPLESIHSLICWDWMDKESLVALIMELIQHYRDYHFQRACENGILKQHLKSLQRENQRNYQIMFDRIEKGGGSATVLIEMDVDLSDMPPCLSEENLGKNSALLLMSVPYPESTKVQTQLHLSPAVEKAFGGSSNLRIPSFQSNMLMGDYYSAVRQLLQNQVQTISASSEKRKDYISAFISHFESSVLEYDFQNFKKIVLLLEWNDFFFTFTVELPLYFPMDHPTFVFKSVYHNQNRKPYTERHTNFPYSPRWNGNEMAKRASAYILESIKSFQMSSVTNADK